MDRNQCAFRHSSRRRPLKRVRVPPDHGCALPAVSGPACARCSPPTIARERDPVRSFWGPAHDEIAGWARGLDRVKDSDALVAQQVVHDSDVAKAVEPGKPPHRDLGMADPPFSPVNLVPIEEANRCGIRDASWLVFVAIMINFTSATL
jgi:hypothetical protein